MKTKTTKEIVKESVTTDFIWKNVDINKKWITVDDVDKDFNVTMHEFSKLMQKYKIHKGVQTKLLVPFMRFHIRLKKK